MAETKKARIGRPPKYSDPAEMQAVIDQYFRDCAGTPLIGADGEVIRDKYGEIVMANARPPTVTGLALALGFTGRQALMDYQARKSFSDTVTRAKSRIEAYAEERLYDRDGQRGAEFSLKYNFKWAQEDKTALTDEGATGVVMLPVIMSQADPPPEEDEL